MPLVRININRITGEKITSIIGSKIAYTTMFNVSLKKDALSVKDESLFEFTLTLNSQPPGINIIVAGNTYIKFQNEKEFEEYKKMDSNKKASFVANMLFPQVYATLIIISRELQIPPPIIKIEQANKEKRSFNNMLSV